MYLIDKVTDVRGDIIDIAIPREMPIHASGIHEIETVRAKIFRDKHGNQFSIGATQEVMDKIGVLFDIREDRMASFDSLVSSTRIMGLERELHKAKMVREVMSELNALPNNIDSLVKEKYEREVGYF